MMINSSFDKHMLAIQKKIRSYTSKDCHNGENKLVHFHNYNFKKPF